MDGVSIVGILLVITIIIFFAIVKIYPCDRDTLPTEAFDDTSTSLSKFIEFKQNMHKELSGTQKKQDTEIKTLETDLDNLIKLYQLKK
jgi:hypothetical protein